MPKFRIDEASQGHITIIVFSDLLSARCSNVLQVIFIQEVCFYLTEHVLGNHSPESEVLQNILLCNLASNHYRNLIEVIFFVGLFVKVV